MFVKNAKWKGAFALVSIMKVCFTPQRLNRVLYLLQISLLTQNDRKWKDDKWLLKHTLLLFYFDSAKSAEIMRTVGGGTKKKEIKNKDSLCNDSFQHVVVWTDQSSLNIEACQNNAKTLTKYHGIVAELARMRCTSTPTSQCHHYIVQRFCGQLNICEAYHKCS